MDSQGVGGFLEDCLRAAKAAATATQQSTKPTETQILDYRSSRDSLCPELASLLQEAMDMKWPFTPEKWQYKTSIDTNDKTNLSDLISKHLSQLLSVLKASIVAQEVSTAMAVVFLVDRFLYWTDESSRLLKITKLLHQCNRDCPVAPQLVIRQARVYLNSGELQKAEYILSSLINNSGATGGWMYQSESERALVQSVSIQVRGMILQKLGLWLGAAELIWASLVGYYSLPQPDKKGIGTSLGLLANVLVSMNDEDFQTFRTNPDTEFQSLLGDGSHRLLSAAQAAKMATVYSQYTSLYVLTNVATQGTCLLSYSFSVECPESQRQSFLQEAREAFEIGLLTKAEGEKVTSKQELHTLLKAAYSLTVVRKWLGTPQELVAQATQACKTALAKFYDFCHTDNQDKDNLCNEIMHLVAQIKLLLRVEPFPNSDKKSFIPDSYRNIKNTPVNFTLEGFSKVIQRFQKFHESMCRNTDSNCKGTKDKVDGARLCITALGTTIGALTTDCNTEVCKMSKDPLRKEEPHQSGSASSAVYPPQNPDLGSTLESTDDLDSSWQKLSLNSSGSSWASSSGYMGSIAIKEGANVTNQSCLPTEFNDERSDSHKKRDLYGCKSASSHTVPQSPILATYSSRVSGDSGKFEMIQGGIETQATDDDLMTDAVGMGQKLSVADGPPKSLSELTLQTSSSSLGDSFSSQSSWEKISVDLNFPTNRTPQPSIQSKAGTGQSSKSPECDESFFHRATVDCETSDSAHELTYKNHTSGQQDTALSKPQPNESLNVDSNVATDSDSVSVKPVAQSLLAMQHQNLPQYASTDTSTESSFEILGESEHQRKDVCSTEKVNVPQKKKPLCYSCQNRSTETSVINKKQYLLSQKDYQALLAGVCHECLLKRLHSDKTKFKFEGHRDAYSALHLKFSKANRLWTARETCVYIGEPIRANGKLMKGNQREAIWVQFLHQEERLSSYVGKDYIEPKQIEFHLKDVERQMTAQYYVTEFNKSLYDKDVMAQIFFIPSEALLILKENEIVGCVTVEPYMMGDFVKLTNNKEKKEEKYPATQYGLAFGHFTYLFSDKQEVVVDLQGWVTANGEGLTYLTDPQIHSTKIPKGKGNFAARGLRYFLEDQHGPECNSICQLLKLQPVEQTDM